MQAAYDEKILEALRHFFPKNNTMEDERHFSRLHKIILGLLDNCLEDELIAAGSELDLTDSEGMTALAWATKINDLPAMSLLLEAKANPNISNNRGISPLFYAVDNMNLASIKLLLNAGADVRYFDSYKSTPLHLQISGARLRKIASTQSKIEAIRILAAAGLNINLQNMEGSTPLQYSAIMDEVGIVEPLLDHGAQIDTRDSDGNTSLASAVFYDAHNSTNLLLVRGANYTTINKTGNTILHHAAHPQNLKVLEVLIAADLTGIDPDLINDNGKTALQLAHDHEPKPEGFIEAFQALLFGIANRNDYVRGIQESGSNHTVQRVPGAWPS